MGVNTSKYKQTELGFIPEDWEVKSYGEVFQFLTSATYSRADLDTGNEVSYIHYGDIHTKFHFFIDFDKFTLPTISQEQVKQYPFLKDGDLIVVDASEDYNGISKSVEIKNLENKKAITGLHTFLLRDNNNVFVNGFRGYLSSNNLIKNQFDKLATGMKVYGVSKGNLKQVLIPIPTKKEQTAIANALSEMDALIDSLEELIAKKKNLKQGALQKLLKPNEGWVKRKLGDVAWFQEGPGLRNWQFTKSGIKVINVTNLENGKINLDRTDRYISIEEFNKVYKHFEINANDIVVASSGNTYGKVAVVTSDKLPLLMNTSVIRFKPTDKITFKFLLIFLNSKSFKDQIDNMITGGAQPNFGPYHLKKVNIDLPQDLDKQNLISDIIFDMDNEIEILQIKLSKYKQLKQGMMQNLLTGKIRLI